MCNVTVIGANELSNVTLWGLSDCDSFSDHAIIEFDLSFSNVTFKVPDRVLFNTMGANWKKNEEICSQDIIFILNHLDKSNSKDSVDRIVDIITSVILYACTKSMPIRRGALCNVPWRSLEISNMRKRVNAAWRRFQRGFVNNIWELYKRKYLDLMKKYNHMLIDAKMNLGEIFFQLSITWMCESIFTLSALEKILWTWLRLRAYKYNLATLHLPWKRLLMLFLKRPFLPIFIGLIIPFMFSGIFQLIVGILYV